MQKHLYIFKLAWSEPFLGYFLGHLLFDVQRIIVKLYVGLLFEVVTILDLLQNMKLLQKLLANKTTKEVNNVKLYNSHSSQQKIHITFLSLCSAWLKEDLTLWHSNHPSTPQWSQKSRKITPYGKAYFHR